MKESILNKLQHLAEQMGYVLNPDTRTLDRLVKHLAESAEQYGKMYCPCKRSYPVNTDKDPVCPCSEAHDEVTHMGHCECRLFYSMAASVQAKRRPGLLATVTCPGWASKIGRAQLASALSGVPFVPDERVLVGNSTADDAGIFQISDDLALVQTVDVLAPVVDDPYTYGKIAATNSLSDVYAMGGTPLSALGIIGFPSGGDPKVMAEILRGGQDVVVEAGASIIGGHSFASDEIKYGLAVTGAISPNGIITNAAAQAGDALILTKPIGVGTIITAMIARGSVRQEFYQSAVLSMLLSNRIASEVMLWYNTNACTDVTGFGFLGHLWEMCCASKVDAVIYANLVPKLDGSIELIQDGVVDPALKNNRLAFKEHIYFESNIESHVRQLMFSSETSGGLIISLPMNSATDFLKELHSVGVASAKVIGELQAGSGKIIIQ